MTLKAEEKFALLRVLAAAMWADGVVSLEEVNFLKGVFNCLKLDAEDWKTVVPFIEIPLNEEECLSLVKDFLGTVNEKSDIAELRGYLTEIFLADGELSEAEQDWRDNLLEILDGRSPATAVIQGLTKWFRKGTTAHSAVLKDFYDVEGFFKNRVLFHLKHKLKSENIEVSIEEPELERLCLLGGILGQVVYADGTLSDTEKKAVQDILLAGSMARPQEMRALLMVVEDRVCADLDLFRLVTEYRNRVDYAHRLKLIDLIFQCASCDRVITEKEFAKIENTAMLLRLNRRDYTNVRSKYYKLIS